MRPATDRDDDPGAPRVLVMTMDRLGDLVNTTPALRAIRRHHPEAHITVEVIAGTEALLSGSDDFDRIWTTPRHRGWAGRMRQLRRMRAGRFHTAYLLEECNDKVILAWLAGIPCRQGLYRSRFRRLYSNCVAISATCHESLGNLRNLLDAVGIDTSDWNVHLALSGDVQLEARKALNVAGWDGNTSLVGINVGASNARRIWTAEGFAEIARTVHAMDAIPVLLGTGADKPMVVEIKRQASTPMLDLVGRTTVGAMAGIIELCVALVTGDTGPMHIAAGLGCPVVALYGPSDPAITGPQGDRHVIVQASNARYDHDAMQSIPASAIVSALSQMIASSRPSTFA